MQQSISAKLSLPPNPLTISCDCLSISTLFIGLLSPILYFLKIDNLLFSSLPGVFKSYFLIKYLKLK